MFVKEHPKKFSGATIALFGIQINTTQEIQKPILATEKNLPKG